MDLLFYSGEFGIQKNSYKVYNETRIKGRMIV